MLPHTCLGVVLAGGLSSRMGQDKATLIRNDVDMLNYSKQLLTKSGIDNVVVSGKSHDVQDLVKNAGPVGGIFSVIERYRPAAILVLPVDLPLMNTEALSKLKLTGELSQKACFYNDNYLPLYLPINAYVEQFLQQAFAQQQTSGRGPSIRQLLKHVPSQEITPAQPNVLFNANTPEQWQQAKSHAFNISSPRKNYV